MRYVESYRLVCVCAAYVVLCGVFVHSVDLNEFNALWMTYKLKWKRRELFERTWDGGLGEQRRWNSICLWFCEVFWCCIIFAAAVVIGCVSAHWLRDFLQFSVSRLEHDVFNNRKLLYGSIKVTIWLGGLWNEKKNRLDNIPKRRKKNQFSTLLVNSFIMMAIRSRCTAHHTQHTHTDTHVGK